MQQPQRFMVQGSTTRDLRPFPTGQRERIVTSTLIRRNCGRQPMTAGQLLAAPINLNHPGHYVHWGVIQISVANLVVIGVMVLLFVAALFLPFPHGRGSR
jgi:hypothetical protein